MDLNNDQLDPQLDAGFTVNDAEAATPVAVAVATTTLSEETSTEQESDVLFTLSAENPEHVQQDFPVFIPLPEGREWNGEAVTLSIPSGLVQTVNDGWRQMPNLDVSKDPNWEEFEANMQGGLWLTRGMSGYDGIDQREGSRFRQAVDSEAGKLGASPPKIADEPGAEITGERALLRIRALTGLGGLIHIPLWHSGFWMTLRTPTEASLLELGRQILEDKITLGRATGGAIFANESVFFASRIVQFASDHLYDTSLQNKTDVFDRVQTLDLQTIAWGLACAAFPQGFQYARSVFDPKEGGSWSVVKELIAVAKLQWIDTAQLTKWQVAHMAKRRPSSMSDDSVKRYLDEFSTGKERLVEVHPNVKLELTVPGLGAYLENGQRWINEIVVNTDRAFGMNQDEKARDNHISMQAKAAVMRQYAHWVSRVYAGNNVISDRDAIDAALEELSSLDDVRPKFFEAINKYLEDSTVSLIAVPTLTDEDEKNVYPRFPRLIPIDAMATFFILLVRKVDTIKLR